MASNVIRATLLADAQKFKAGFKESEQAVSGFEKRTGQAATLIKGYLGVQAARAVVDFAQDSVRAFSELEQSVGGTEAVFGDASASIDNFASTSARSIGLSESAFRTSTTLIGGQLKRMTGDVDFAAEHSIILTKTAADLAATYGGTTAEAVNALGAAFRGEADPAERFNLDLKIGRVNAKALEMGLADSSGAIDDNAKAQATLALITEQSADASGQFAREQDTVAGKTAIATAEIEDQKARLGEILAPVKSLTTELQLLAAKGLGIVALGIQNLMGDISNVDYAIGAFQIHTGATADTLEAAVTINREYGISFEELFASMQFSEDGLHTLTDANENFLLSIGYTQDEVDALSNLINRKLVVAQNDARDAARHHKGAQEELADATAEATEEITSQADFLRALTDPLFAAMEATRDLEAAQADYDAVLANSESTIADQEAALADLWDAQLNLIASQEELSSLGPGWKDQFRQRGEALGFPIDQINQIIARIEYLNAIELRDKTIRVRYREDTSPTGGTRPRASGGPVQKGRAYEVGEMGREVFVPSENGTIIPNSQISRVNGGGGGVVNGATPNVNIYVTVSALDPRSASKAVMSAIQEALRNGSLPPWWPT